MDWAEDNYSKHREIEVDVKGVKCQAFEWIPKYVDDKHYITIYVTNEVVRLGFRTPEFFKARDAGLPADWYAITGPYDAWFNPQPWSGYQI